ncbi:unnamed protein product [Echinostoma caproni]|uniref:RING-type domain-containing protein n=1 Tax=Echinostoma caproni TaxID=27848 RepID=A0A183A6X2_9TREM|nr:unnamed protein product [Echinostoma caproni]
MPGSRSSKMTNQIGSAPAVQNAHQTSDLNAGEHLKANALDVKALVFEFEHPAQPVLKVFTNTNTYYLSATVRQIPNVSRVPRDLKDLSQSTVSTFRDREMPIPEPSEADTLAASSMEDISDITLMEQPAPIYQVAPQMFQEMDYVPRSVPITRISGPPTVELPVVEDRRIRNRQYSFISVKLRTPASVGIVLLRTFRLTPAHMASQIPCTICDKMYKSGEAVIILPCSHLFHKNCILLHLNKTSKLCPACGKDITKVNHPTLTDVSSISSTSETSISQADTHATLRSV